MQVLQAAAHDDVVEVFLASDPWSGPCVAFLARACPVDQLLPVHLDIASCWIGHEHNVVARWLVVSLLAGFLSGSRRPLSRSLSRLIARTLDADRSRSSAAAAGALSPDVSAHLPTGLAGAMIVGARV